MPVVSIGGGMVAGVDIRLWSNVDTGVGGV